MATTLGTASLADAEYRRGLGDGLVLRWSIAGDAARLGALVAEVFGDRQRPKEAESAWVRETLGGRHPFCGPGAWALVEDMASGRAVAATALLRQTWTYAGIPFPVGRPEDVVTLPGYRGRGLIRAIFELLHARSAAQGDLAQVIDGIPFFYRQFGYDYALDSFGGRSVYLSAVPDLPPGDAEPHTLRPAAVADVPLLQRLYDQEQADALVAVQAGEAYWRWVVAEQDHISELGWTPLVIRNATANSMAEVVGYVVLRDGWQWGDERALCIVALAVTPGRPLRRVLPSVLRGLRALIPSLPERMAVNPVRLLFLLGREHPVYAALNRELVVPARRPYAWYVRVPDLAAFLRHVALELERRLAASDFAGLSRTLAISFYRGRLALRFEAGRLAGVEEWYDRRGMGPGETGGAGVGMAREQFVQLVFGYRSLEELREWHADVLADDEDGRLLEVLFPKRLSRALLLN